MPGRYPPEISGGNQPIWEIRIGKRTTAVVFMGRYGDIS